MTPEARWSVGEATILRTAAMIQLGMMGFGLVAPGPLFSAWGLPFAEPATFLRVVLVAWGALGLALLRVVRLPRGEGRLLVETIGIVKLAFVMVVVVDILARKLPSQAAIGAILDLIFGVALFRAGRRPVRTPS
ncbi:MAG: hypothetical protein HYV09_37010 [Deltaproteobacteria bacterium]|nr:hypothetical protein [Deltaproteobacteria bacterium]